jgi:hypothetical protein
MIFGMWVHDDGHYCTRHTALWSCTHIPNIIDLSGKTKKVWSGQASLRRSGGRKNQTKTTIDDFSLKLEVHLAMPIRDIMNVFILGNDFFLCLYSAGHNSRK